MKVSLLGVQDLDFKTREGDIIQGIKLHICFIDPNVSGRKVDTKFISRSALANLQLDASSFTAAVGKEIDLQTDFNGKVYAVDL